MSTIIEFASVSKYFYADVDVSSRRALLDMFLPARLRRSPRKAQFHALREVSFAVNRGESVLVLGAAGAGKSTLARLLAGLLAPDAGKIVVNGRCALIAHVTAGFKPMLSVRENLLFKSVLLGMARGEALKRGDEILQFAGLRELAEKKVFDLPAEFVAKLGYAVCLHAEADLYIFDDKIAVGDEEFKQRCFQRAAILTRRATTLFLTSKPTVMALPVSRALVLHAGRLIHDGAVEEGIALYKQNLLEEVALEALTNDSSISIEEEARAYLLEESGAEESEGENDADLIEASEEELLVASTETLDRRHPWKSLDFDVYLRHMHELEKPEDIDLDLFKNLTPEQRYINSRHYAGKTCLVLRAAFNEHNIILHDIMPVISRRRSVELAVDFTPKKNHEVTAVVCEIFSASRRHVVRQIFFTPAPGSRFVFKTREAYSLTMRMAGCWLDPGRYGIRIRFLREGDTDDRSNQYKLIVFAVKGRKSRGEQDPEGESHVEWSLTATPLLRCVSL